MFNIGDFTRMATREIASTKARQIMRTGTSHIVRDTVFRHPPIGRIPTPTRLPRRNTNLRDILNHNSGMIKSFNLEWGGKTYTDVLTKLAKKTHITKLIEIAQKLDSVTKDITITEDQILDAVEFFWWATRKDDEDYEEEEYQDDEDYVTIGDTTLTREEYDEAIQLYKAYLLIKSMDKNREVGSA